MKRIELDGIKARMGSVPLSVISQCPLSIQKLMIQDLPKLIAIAEKNVKKSERKPKKAVTTV